MDQLDREVLESLSEPAKRVFGSLDYRSRQRMLKKAKAMAKEEKTRNQKKSRVKKKGIEKQNKAKRKKKGSSSKSERVLFSIYETKDLMVQDSFHTKRCQRGRSGKDNHCRHDSVCGKS